MAGVITAAGILEGGKLTDVAIKKFIKDVKDELRLGSTNSPATKLFPCGPELPPFPNADLIPLEDETKFPDFHKNIIHGTYEKIAIAMDVESQLSLLPICDPIAFAFKLGIKIKIPNFPGGFIPFLIPNIPMLAVKLDIMPPPQLILKIPSILIPIPKLPLPTPPDLGIPSFDPKLHIDIIKFNLALITTLPTFMLSLVAKIPTFALKLPNLPGLFNVICELAFESKLFGDILPTSLVQLAVTKVLIRKVVEMSFMVAIGVTLGAAPGGIVGGVARFLGYNPPDEGGDSQPTDPRKAIVNYASACTDMSLSTSAKSKDDDYVRRLLPIESQEPSTGPSSEPRAIGYIAAKQKLANVPSGGLFAKQCLMAGGASAVMTYPNNSELTKSPKSDPSSPLYYDFFADEHRFNAACSGIISAALIKDAFVSKLNTPILNDLPSVKSGDVIITSKGKLAHALIVATDYSGNFKLETYEGGQPDGSTNAPTAIKKKSYASTGGNTIKLDANKNIIINDQSVLCIIDGKKICTIDKGSDMSKPAGVIDTSICKDDKG